MSHEHTLSFTTACLDHLRCRTACHTHTHTQLSCESRAEVSGGRDERRRVEQTCDGELGQLEGQVSGADPRWRAQDVGQGIAPPRPGRGRKVQYRLHSPSSGDDLVFNKWGKAQIKKYGSLARMFTPRYRRTFKLIVLIASIQILNRKTRTFDQSIIL